MPFSKLYDSPAAAVADIPDGATILLGGASPHDAPAGLLAALAQSGVRGLACVCDFAARRNADENEVDSDPAVAGVIAQLAVAGVIAPYHIPSTLCRNRRGHPAEPPGSRPFAG